MHMLTLPKRLLCVLAWLALSQLALASDEAERILAQPVATNQQLEADALEVLQHIAYSEDVKQKLPAFIKEATTAIEERKGAIPARLALKIADTISHADRMRNQLFKLALNHRSALYRVDAGISDDDRLSEIIIAMSAAVLLYENHQAMHDYFESQPLLRKKLDEGYPELGIAPGFYRTSVTRAGNHEYRKAMADAIAFFNENQANIGHQMALSSTAFQRLNDYIARSQVTQQYNGGNVFRELLRLPKHAVNVASELPKAGLKSLKFNSSKAVGNTLGLVRWREGKLKHDETMLTALLSQLEPGDILLEKTPFTLTDKTIPGHFGHAALYIGTADQLQALGLDSHPEIQSQLSQISVIGGVVEALRGGVQLHTLKDFMNIDDIAIVRPKNRSQDQQIQAVKIAIGNLGKRYDFNFDVNTTETIVCSELVYMAYPHIDFITKQVLSSYTISPDDIAQLVGEEPQYPLGLVLFAHDGQLVYDQDRLGQEQALFANLVRTQSTEAMAQEKPFFEGFIAKQ